VKEDRSQEKHNALKVEVEKEKNWKKGHRGTSILLFWGDFIKWTATLDSVLFSAVHWWSRLMAVRIYTFLQDLWPPLHSKDPLLRLAVIQAPGSELLKMQIKSTKKATKLFRRSTKLYIGYSAMLCGITEQ